jgi:hypothetical protein
MSRTRLATKRHKRRKKQLERTKPRAIGWWNLQIETADRGRDHNRFPFFAWRAPHSLVPTVTEAAFIAAGFSHATTLVKCI